jgi:hypothetical protein
MRIHWSSASAARLLRDESGQALVEFAFVLIMMLALTLGLIDFGRLFLRYEVMTDATREATRRAVVAADWPADSIYQGLLGQLDVGGIDTAGAVLVPDECGAPPTDVTVVTVNECQWDGESETTNAKVGVSVPFEFSLVGPLIGWATGDRAITLRRSFTMRNE